MDTDKLMVKPGSHAKLDRRDPDETLGANKGECEQVLQKHLAKEPDAPTGKRLYVVDESSLVSTRQMHDFLQRLSTNDRVLLVGDARCCQPRS